MPKYASPQKQVLSQEFKFKSLFTRGGVQETL